jgi:bifunctional enzyme CysN/CysC
MSAALALKAAAGSPQIDAVAAIDAYVAEQSRLDLLRFITCGSVDDGKSTLIGRLLYESKLIFDDQLEELEASSKKHGTQGGAMDFALLVDGLAAEREQGITIDVAYRFFNTDRRKFIVADTPGHEQYTRNMVTGASTADVAVILIDARYGVLTQTRRHSLIASLVGVRHVVLAINKMDLCNWEQARFEEIVASYQAVGEGLGFISITAIPMSALTGDNVVDRSTAMAWYEGPTLLDYLETVPVRETKSGAAFRFPVQWVNRPNLDFRGFSGLIESGTISVGDAISITPSGQRAHVARIILGQQDLASASAGRSVTITLDREVDVSRGDLLVGADAPVEAVDQVVASLVWMDVSTGHVGRPYLLKIGTSVVGATITAIAHRLDVNSFDRSPARALGVNDVCEVTLTLDRPVGIEPFATSKGLGSFILIDRQSNATLAAGMVVSASRRAASSTVVPARIDRAARARLNGHLGKLLWLTGTDAPALTALGGVLEARLYQKGYRVWQLNQISQVGSDPAAAAAMMVDAGLIVIATLPELAPPPIGADDLVVVRVGLPAAAGEGALLLTHSELGPDHLADQILASVSFALPDETLFYL